MAKLYWVTFRLKEDTSRDERYDGLMAAIRESCAGKWWVEPTSFVVFRSELSIAALTARLSIEINEKRDLLVIGMPDFKSARVVGRVEDPDLFSLWPWIEPA